MPKIPIYLGFKDDYMQLLTDNNPRVSFVYFKDLVRDWESYENKEESRLVRVGLEIEEVQQIIDNLESEIGD